MGVVLLVEACAPSCHHGYQHAMFLIVYRDTLPKYRGQFEYVGVGQ